MKTVNLNKGDLYLNRLPYGTTQNMEIHVGRYTYMIDVNRSVNTTFIELYNKVSTDRESYSKYDKNANLAIVTVNSDGVLTREFFENFYTISAAQKICAKFSNIINM